MLGYCSHVQFESCFRHDTTYSRGCQLGLLRAFFSRIVAKILEEVSPEMSCCPVESKGKDPFCTLRLAGFQKSSHATFGIYTCLIQAQPAESTSYCFELKQLKALEQKSQSSLVHADN